MLNKYLLAGWLFCLTALLQAQIPDDFIRIDISKLEGLRIVQERTYTRESLFGYMNGGAELYLEYGFERLVVSDLKFDGKDLKVEVYRMPSPDMAFGIYSVNIFRCEDVEDLSEFYCQSEYQVQVLKGSYYINIVNSSGSPEGLDYARQIASYFIGELAGDDFSLDKFLEPDQQPEGIEKIMLIAGEVALENYAFEYSEYLEAYKDYILLVVEYPGGTLLLIVTGEKGTEIVHIDA